MLLSRFGVLAGAVIAVLFASAGPGYAQGQQSYPSRPVRFIVPFPPGGGTDLAGRLLARKFADELGQPFVVDNRPGAGSTLGAGIAAKAPADGYTMLFASASFAISASYYRILAYDPVNDFDGIGLVVSGPLVLVAHPSLAATSIQELIALAKSKPGALNYASSGAGTITHLATEMFLDMSRTRITHVAYKGASPARIALLGGEVQILIAPLGPTLTHIKSGKLNALGVCGARRSALLPSAPTIAESGVPGYEADTWYGLLAPRGAPRPVIELLNKKIAAALKSDELNRQLAAQGFEPAWTTPKQFDAYVKSEVAKWGKVMKDAGVRQN